MSWFPVLLIHVRGGECVVQLQTTPLIPVAVLLGGKVCVSICKILNSSVSVCLSLLNVSECLKAKSHLISSKVLYC